MFLCKSCSHPDLWHLPPLQSNFTKEGRCTCGCKDFVADTLEYLEAKYNQKWVENLENENDL